MPNPWIVHLKAYALKNKITYKQAMQDPKSKYQYQAVKNSRLPSAPVEAPQPVSVRVPAKAQKFDMALAQQLVKPVSRIRTKTWLLPMERGKHMYGDVAILKGFTDNPVLHDIFARMLGDESDYEGKKLDAYIKRLKQLDEKKLAKKYYELSIFQRMELIKKFPDYFVEPKYDRQKYKDDGEEL